MDNLSPLRRNCKWTDFSLGMVIESAFMGPHQTAPALWGFEETIKFILNTEGKCIYFVFEGVVSGQGDDWFFSGCAARGS